MDALLIVIVVFLAIFAASHVEGMRRRAEPQLLKIDLICVMDTRSRIQRKYRGNGQEKSRRESVQRP